MRFQFAVCVKNKGYEASLEICKVYRVITDRTLARHGYVRVVDESGEDYGYSAKRFVPITLPKRAQKALFKASSPRRSNSGRPRPS
jgi:hypothetical protein